MTAAAGNDQHVVWAGLNERWFDAVNTFSRHTPWLHTPARLFAQYGVVVFALILLWSWWRARSTGEPRSVAASVWAPFGMLIAVGLNQFISNAVTEPRPFVVFSHALVLAHHSTDYSFPSDHSVMAGAVAIGVLLAHRRLGLITVGLAILMAAARVYIGVHFPLDVIAGLLVGGVVALGTFFVLRPLLLRLVALVAHTPLRWFVAPQRAQISGAGRW
ncbi:phosphatase PAP2 family protein [Nocardioides sp.]|uniref:phosphatase PAP2 family protein n=1 Tax=Nocardioides sp. TaxID=35761 RepID=UPI002612ACE3|nr:phosphatase PAP2 family protein [Nocardioides sp.]